MAYQGALGIKASCWDPSGQFLAVGAYDQVGAIPPSVKRSGGGSLLLLDMSVEGLNTPAGVEGAHACRNTPMNAMQKLRVYNDVTWEPLLQGDHPASVSGPEGVAVYSEVPHEEPADQQVAHTPKQPGTYREVSGGAKSGSGARRSAPEREESVPPPRPARPHLPRPAVRTFCVAAGEEQVPRV